MSYPTLKHTNLRFDYIHVTKTILGTHDTQHILELQRRRCWGLLLRTPNTPNTELCWHKWQMSENKARTNPDQYGKPTPKGTFPAFPANLLGDVRSSWIMDVDETQNLAQHSSQSPLPPPLDNCRPHRCFQSPSKTNDQNWISNCLNCMIAAVEW